MKTLNRKWISAIALSLSFFWIISCSEEIVVIEEIDRKKLDSIDNLIIVTTDELTASKIAKDALQRRVDSLNAAIAAAKLPGNQNPDIVYTVQVIDGGTAAITGRTKSLQGAVVRISQGNTSTQLTTDASGMVTFPRMRDGIVAVTVEIDNYADVYMMVDLRDNGTDPDATNAAYRNAATQVLLFPTSGANMFTISGVAYYNQNLTNQRANTQNDPTHPFTGNQIYETVPAGTNFSIRCTPNIVPLNHNRPGRILQVVYAGLERVATAAANGSFSVQIPVVLRTNGAQFLTYVGPNTMSPISGTQQLTPTQSVDQLWYPVSFWPSSLANTRFFPGGSVISDVYFED